MATFTEDEIKDAARVSTSSIKKTAKAILEEASVAPPGGYDVFLSYSSHESDELILGVKNTLIKHGLAVYVDKFDDPHMKPNDVSKDTAETLRSRLRQSKSLLYLHSENSGLSMWMPWELGFFDGYRSKVAIFPITKTSRSTYVGQEYLGVYPYVGQANNTNGVKRLWIWEEKNKYAVYPSWVKGEKDITLRS
ncbi:MULTISPECIES: TIR domain-containing protein [unclassified Ochrobactrum]|uniref:TIR domain-containing protein n=1 Tax=unclassified Ochrobactrum TaxID=239106 RepID=UPI000DEF76AD|nr:MULTISPECIES: TIR domain-containing protein [unclassified Ochrobactrum]MBQ0711259.1 toll/interleukin-1 receptor domain-containing protein [Ochrobactrum sp. AP1BH01-1]